MTRYRKKPVDYIEAWQVGSSERMPEWIEFSKLEDETTGRTFIITTGNYPFRLCRGEWIVRHRGLCGGFFERMTNHDFCNIYEVVE